MVKKHKVKGLLHTYAFPQGKGKYVIWCSHPKYKPYQVSVPVTKKQAKKSLGMEW
jgi:hypothetical protein